MGSILSDSTIHKSKTVFSVCGLESPDAEGQQYALFYVILYKELEYLRILVSVGVLEPIPPDTKGQVSFGGVKSYVRFFTT